MKSDFSNATSSAQRITGADVAKAKKPFEPFTRVADFGRDLRGLGGQQTVHLKALKGSTFGPASKGRRLSRAERDAVVAQMRKEGKL